MISSKKKYLTMAILSAISSMSFMASVSAEEVTDSNLENYDLENVVIEEKVEDNNSNNVNTNNSILSGEFVKTESSLGILGDKKVMDTPFTQMDLTKKTIETFGGPNQPLQSILINNPAVRIQGTNLHNDFSIRGIRGNGTSSYLNGIPGLMSQFNAPTFFIEDIQFISGPNSGITSLPATYESSAAGGIVNFVSKKATDIPITNYRQTFSGKGSLGEYLDISRRLGKDNEWGIRVNTEWLNGETAISDNDMEARGIYINVDHQDEKSKSNFLAGYRRLNIEGGARWFSLDSKAIGKDITKIPNAPDANKNYGINGLAKEAFGYVLALNHEQQMNDDWKWFFNAGLNKNKLERNIIGKGSNFVITNDKGDVKTPLMSTQTDTKNYYAQFGVNGKIESGDIEHDLTLAYDRAWRSIGSAKDNYNGKMGSIVGNIYDGLYGENVWFPEIETGTSSKDRYWGISLVDNLKYKKSQLLLGIHKHNSIATNYNNKTGETKQKVSADEICPTYGYVYQPDEHISVYASHSENFDKGTIVGSGYKNTGDILAPAKTKQNEIGVKYQNAGFLTTLSTFNIKQANNIDVNKGEDLYYLQDGEQEYKGIELSFNGKLADKWNFMGGLMYLDATQNKTKDGINNGKTVNGVARWNGIAALEYNPDDKFSIIGRAIYTGSADMYNEQLKAPSYMTYDLGFSYKTQFKDTPVTISAMCYNLTNKDYWTAYGNNLILNNPRTFMLSATFDI